MMKRQSEEVESVEDAEQPLVKSKTQRKKEMIELQELGKRLVDLTKSQLAAIDLPQELLDALKLAKQLKRGEALRRQTQHIGALMRSVDPEPIRLLVENIDHIHQKSVDKFHQLEIYRDQLLNADPDVFGELSIKFPQLDRQ
ncbi:MAG: DUF615 domain-containing protein, partial [Proteobacteria bacterium]|nr:DUF615 domain-containing protein [Pseudomonadota bacterium]